MNDYRVINYSSLLSNVLESDILLNLETEKDIFYVITKKRKKSQSRKEGHRLGANDRPHKYMSPQR